jgi:hypothetical protein
MKLNCGWTAQSRILAILHRQQHAHPLLLRHPACRSIAILGNIKGAPERSAVSFSLRAGICYLDKG